MFRPSLRSSLPHVAALLIWLTAAGAAPAQLYLLLDPPVPSAGEPFQAVIYGEIPFGVSLSPNPDDLFYTFDGTTLTIFHRGTSGGVIGLPTTEPYAATLPIDGLPQGTYQFEVILGHDDMPPPILVPGSGLKSLPPTSFTVAQPVSLDGPTLVDASNTLRYAVSRHDPCAELGDTEILPDPSGSGGVVRLPWLVPCTELPSLPQRLETEPFGPLAAGEWEIQVVDVDNQPLIRRPLTVLPNPVTLQHERFELDVIWQNNLAAGPAFPAATPTDDSALFAFFQRDNWEVMVKVLDGCNINGFYWVFIAANTDQGYDVTVTDTVSETERTYSNPIGMPSPATTDVEAFACN